MKESKIRTKKKKKYTRRNKIKEIKFNAEQVTYNKLSALIERGAIKPFPMESQLSANANFSRRRTEHCQEQIFEEAITLSVQ